MRKNTRIRIALLVAVVIFFAFTMQLHAKESCPQITAEEMLKKIATAEAGNQGADGMWLVMSVVENRVTSKDYPDNVRDVLYQRGQFSSVANGSYDKVTEFSEECCEAYDRIKAADIAPEIVAFENAKSNFLDRYYSYAFTYRDHRFYTKRDKGG